MNVCGVCAFTNNFQHAQGFSVTGFLAIRMNYKVNDEIDVYGLRVEKRVESRAFD